jgi:hypothetical protein
MRSDSGNGFFDGAVEQVPVQGGDAGSDSAEKRAFRLTSPRRRNREHLRFVGTVQRISRPSVGSAGASRGRRSGLYICWSRGWGRKRGFPYFDGDIWPVKGWH